MLAPLLVLLLQTPTPPVQPTFEQQLLEAPSRDILEVPAGMTRLQAKTLPVDRPGGVQPQGGGKGKSQGSMLTAEKGLRLLIIDLTPREKVRFVMGGDGVGALVLSIAPSPQPDGMESETARVNRIPPQFRSRELEIVNVTTGVYPLLLRISGPTGLPYSLEIIRKAPPLKAP